MKTHSVTKSTDELLISPPPTYRGLAEVARRIPPFRNGRPTHVNTVVRWIEVGVKLRDGRICKLRGTRFPGRWLVTDEALDEFLAALTADRGGDPDAPELRTATAHRKSSERAERELEQIGI